MSILEKVLAIGMAVAFLYFMFVVLLDWMFFGGDEYDEED